MVLYFNFLGDFLGDFFVTTIQYKKGDVITTVVSWNWVMNTNLI